MSDIIFESLLSIIWFLSTAMVQLIIFHPSLTVIVSSELVLVPSETVTPSEKEVVVS